MAEKTLVIVESPAKAKTINRYLGRKYIVKASVGHIKDLATFKLSVDVENNFQPKYVTIRGKGEILKEIRKLSKTSKAVLIATDPDREGEAIAWHLAEEVKKYNDDVKRVIFTEITKTGVKKGLNEPSNIDEKLFMSQQARRVMDRLIGFQVSPFLSRAMIFKTSKALSAGRVQSVALRIICKRDKLIKNFVPIEYWNITANFSINSNIFTARLISFDGKNIKNPEGSAKGLNNEEQTKIDKKLAKTNYLSSEKEALDLLNRIKKEEYFVNDINKKSVIRKPYAPFTTSSLQQEAARRLGFTNKKTMSLAQKLYEGVSINKEGAVGLITYMRTDSVRISSESQSAAGTYISQKYGANYIPETPPVYFSKSKNVQDAHEAIRPTILDYTPEEIRNSLDKDLSSLYELIYNRFIASQMKPAVYDKTTINIKDGDFLFRTTGSILVFDGFLAAYHDINENEENGSNGNGKNGKDSFNDKLLPNGLAEGVKLPLEEAKSIKSQTKALAKYNSASLVKELDEKGIGRPSTYATIISTLLDRDYIIMEKKAFSPTELGIDVNEVLVKNFPDLINVEFTAQMETELDLVANGDKTYVEMLKNFYQPFSKSLKHAEEHGDIPEINCEKCGAPMVIKVSRHGRFLGCSNYPECKFTKPLPKIGEKNQKEPVIAEGVFCDKCGSPMYIRESKYGKFYGCSKYPKCKFTKPLPRVGNQVKKEPVLAEGVFCDKCGSPMYIRENKYGKFYGCSKYPKCDGIKPFSTGISCPKCKEGEVVERFSPKSKKKFYACSRYPDCDYISKYEPVNQKCISCGHDYLEARFKKVDGEWVKYLKCPECNESFDLPEEKEEKKD